MDHSHQHQFEFVTFGEAQKSLKGQKLNFEICGSEEKSAHYEDAHQINKENFANSVVINHLNLDTNAHFEAFNDQIEDNHDIECPEDQQFDLIEQILDGDLDLTIFGSEEESAHDEDAHQINKENFANSEFVDLNTDAHFEVYGNQTPEFLDIECPEDQQFDLIEQILDGDLDLTIFESQDVAHVENPEKVYENTGYNQNLQDGIQGHHDHQSSESCHVSNPNCQRVNDLNSVSLFDEINLKLADRIGKDQNLQYSEDSRRQSSLSEVEEAYHGQHSNLPDSNHVISNVKHQVPNREDKNHSELQTSPSEIEDARCPDEPYIDTFQLAEAISAELSSLCIIQKVFARIVLDRSQGTLSGLLKRPKRWEDLNWQGKETYMKLWNWLQQPVEVRMKVLNAQSFPEFAKKAESRKRSYPESSFFSAKRPRMEFTNAQRNILTIMFRENPKPSVEVREIIAEQMRLDVSTVTNFFNNSWSRQGNDRA